MEDHSFKLQLAEVIGTWMGVFMVIFGGIFGIIQYLDHKQALRVDRSMAFVERYHADNLLMKSRLQISDVISNRLDKLNELLTDPDLLPEQLPSLYEQQILVIVDEEDLAGPLEHLFTFYEQIVLCQDMVLCDTSVTENFFDTDGLSFLRTFYPYICFIRREWSNPKQYARVVDYYLGNSENLCT